MDSNSWATNYYSRLEEPGSYAISNLPPGGPYWIRAYRDSNGDFTNDLSEARGITTEAVSATARITAINIELTDPDSDGDGLSDYQETLYGLDPTRRNQVDSSNATQLVVFQPIE
jgi:hypothetical protein